MQRCISLTFTSKIPPEVLDDFVNLVHLETTKNGLAPGNAFVLVEWCSILLQDIAGTALWERWGLKTLECHARVLDLCLSGSSRTIKHSALIVTWRALRKAFSDPDTQKDLIGQSVLRLSSKSSEPSAKNAAMLGAIAGVCARKPKAKEVLATRKSHYYSFYVREILGSRTLVPSHVANALDEFFVHFATEADIEKELVPALEKALLRAPEIVLNDLVTPLFKSFPDTINLSKVLQTKLLKPLLANTKSTNAAIRQGALSAFKAAVLKSHDMGTIAQIAEEILSPLQSGKLASADQRSIHADMLAALPVSKIIAAKVVPALSISAAKEANEAALVAETSALLRYLEWSVLNGAELDKRVVDVFVKGVSEKKVPVKKLWTIRLGELFWAVTDLEIIKSKMSALAEAAMPALMESWQDVIANQITAAQSGLVTCAYVFAAIASSKLAIISNAKIDASLKKAQISRQSLTIEPKPSFFLNPRVYGKLGSEDEFKWFIRALSSFSKEVSSFKPESPVAIAWSQAVIFCICASTVQAKFRKDAAEILSQLYLKDAAHISEVIVTGLWRWRDAVELGEKDSAAVTAKTGMQNTHLVVKAICLPQATLTRLGHQVDESVRKQQMVSLLVLSRPELLPQVSWIDLCLRVGVDPGELAKTSSDALMQQISKYTEFSEIVRTCIKT